MVTLSPSQIELLDLSCEKLLKNKGIRFVAVINKLGKKISGGFKDGVTPLVPTGKAQLHYMQLCLDVSMRKDLQKNLGDIECVIAERKKVNIICIPYKKHFVMISTYKYLSTKVAITKANQIFRSAKRFL